MSESLAAPRKPKLVGINHVALEVGDLDAAIAFYQSIFDFALRGRNEHGAFLDMGDQFLALMRTEEPHQDRTRHFGLVVDDRSAVRDLAEAAGARVVAGPFLDFLDPWGNRIEVVTYADVQFTKARTVLAAMGLNLEKSPQAREELAAKGIVENDEAVRLG